MGQILWRTNVPDMMARIGSVATPFCFGISKFLTFGGQLVNVVRESAEVTTRIVGVPAL